MDKAEEIFKQRQRAFAFLAGDANFVKTSDHPAWQGKIKCLYCKSTGYPGDVQSNPVWWGRNHGLNCKWKELFFLKQYQQRLQPTITYSTNTNWNGNWYTGNAGTIFRSRI